MLVWMYTNTTAKYTKTRIFLATKMEQATKNLIDTHINKYDYRRYLNWLYNYLVASYTSIHMYYC